MASDTTVYVEDLGTEITPEDVIGHRIFNVSRGLGLGKAERTVANVYDDGMDAFECRVGGEDGEKTVYRRVDTIMSNIANLGYRLCDESLEPVEEV